MIDARQQQRHGAGSRRDGKRRMGVFAQRRLEIIDHLKRVHYPNLWSQKQN